MKTEAKVKDILIRSTRLLKGPNLWTAVYVPMIESIIDIGLLEECPSNKVPGLYERLSAWLPGLIEHRCSPGCRGGFLMRLEEGTWPGHILEHITLELQTQAGLPAGFGRTREASDYGVYKLIFQTPNEPVGLESLYSGRDLLMAAIEDRTYDVAAAIERIRVLVDRYCLGPSTKHIISAAKARNIPRIRLNEGNLVQLGYGKHQRRIWTAETDATSAIGENISRDKNLTKSLLDACGIPVPQGRVVPDAETAWTVAQELGFPVVVKPEDGNRGRGVFINLFTEPEVKMAYEQARVEGSGVLVERYIAGKEHRLLVVGGKLLAAARGDAVVVVGDGQHSIRQLIDQQINIAPHRGNLESYTLNLVNVDAAVEIELARQGMQAETIPAPGQKVLVQRNGNVSIDCTDLVHPEVALRAEQAARIVGLDIAGIDLVADDIRQPLEAQGGAIIEVNAGPGLLMHAQPSEGEARPVGQAIVNHLFPEGQTSRIPIVGVSGSTGMSAVAKMCAHVLRISGLETGLACAEGLYVGKQKMPAKIGDSYDSAQRLLKNPFVDAAVIETRDLLILEEGMAYDFCQVGIVTNLAFNPEIKRFDLHDEDAQFKVLRTQVDVVMPETGDAVLNAEDAQVADMARLSEGGVIFFALNPDAPVLLEHCATGGRAVTVENQHVVWREGEQRQSICPLEELPNQVGATQDDQTRYALAVVGMAKSLGLSSAQIRAAFADYSA